MNIPENYIETPKQPLNIFTEYETMELLKLIEDPEIQKLFATYRKKHKYVWTLISNILAEKGITKSEDKCANRFENMKAKFFKIEKRRMQGYNEDNDWPYYEFFVRFTSNNYITSDFAQMQQHLPQTMLQLSHHSYMSKVKFEPGPVPVPGPGPGPIPLMDQSYPENSEMLRGPNPMHHSFGFNANGIQDIQSNNIESKNDYQITAEQHLGTQREQQSHQQQQQNGTEESQENSDKAEEEKQLVLISPHYVQNVERTDSEHHIENSNEETSNTPIPSASNGNNSDSMNKNLNGFHQSVQITSNQQQLPRKNPHRSCNSHKCNTNNNLPTSSLNTKFARKFKKIKIDEELTTIRKEKYALELEILRFQLENEKKLNEKHCLDLKILEERLKTEKYHNELLAKKLRAPIVANTMENNDI